LNFKKNWLKAARPAVEVSIDLLTRIAQIYYGNFKGGAIENKKRKEIRKNNDDYQKFTVATCELQKVEITKLDHDQKLAFFLNVLNTLALHSVIEADKIPEGGASWYSLSGNAAYNIGGFRYTSFEICHGVLRAAMHIPVLPFASVFFKKAKIRGDDPRRIAILTKPEPLISFACFLPTVSSPPLKVFTAEEIRTELQEVALSFLKREVQIDLQNNQIILPRMFSWYCKDFSISPSKKTETIQTLKVLLPDELKLDLFKLDEKKLSVKFSSYNWKPAFNIEPVEYDKIALLAREFLQKERLRTSQQQIAETPVFGTPFDLLMKKYPINTKIPPFFEKALSFIESHGLTVEGIYRLSGSAMEISKLKRLINRGADIKYNAYEIHSICSIVKSFLREMPEPLLPFEFTPKILEICTVLTSSFEQVKYALICVFNSKT